MDQSSRVDLCGKKKLQRENQSQGTGSQSTLAPVRDDAERDCGGCHHTDHVNSRDRRLLCWRANVGFLDSRPEPENPERSESTAGSNQELLTVRWRGKEPERRELPAPPNNNMSSLQVEHSNNPTSAWIIGNAPLVRKKQNPNFWWVSRPFGHTTWSSSVWSVVMEMV